MAKLSITSRLSLPNSSLTIPQLGFGVYQAHGSKCVNACTIALEAGYRQLDSAQFYGNEAEVGQAVADSQIPRSECFLTTKIWSAKGSVGATYSSIVDSVKKIGGSGGYCDLFLIHTASGGAAGRKTMWLALEKAFEEGKVKSIGVSNWGIGHIEEMKEYATVWPPHVNQIELHPWCQQRDIVKYCLDKGIVIQAYCPLVRNQKANDQTLLALAEKHSKSTGQVLIRYCLQKGWVPLPKSETPSRILGNANVFDFSLDEQDMQQLDSLDQRARGAIVEAVDN